MVDLKPEEETFRHAEIERQSKVEFGVHWHGPVEHRLDTAVRQVDRASERRSIQTQRLEKLTRQKLAGTGVVQPFGISDRP